MKLDTIENHVGKVYEKKIVDGEEKSIFRWKSSEECQHVKYADEYNKYLIIRKNLRQVEEASHLYSKDDGKKFVYPRQFN
jgi:hypothetical protein